MGPVLDRLMEPSTFFQILDSILWLDNSAGMILYSVFNEIEGFVSLDNLSYLWCVFISHDNFLDKYVIFRGTFNPPKYTEI